MLGNFCYRLLLACVVFVLCFVFAVLELTAQAEFYKGKTVSIMVAYPAGGAYDTYSRILARHIGKHIPGNPTIIVENKTGAGGIVAVNFLYNRTKPDGLTIGNWNGALSLQKYLGREGMEFDPTRFEWIGAPAVNTFLCMVGKRTGLTSLKDWIESKKAVKIGGMAPGADPSDVARILGAALKLPMQLVEGYQGGAPIRLAYNNHEVDGVCGSWETLGPTWTIELEHMAIMVQAVTEPHPDLPNVPLAIDFAKTEEARMLIKVRLHDMSRVGLAYTLPPGTPKDRTQTLRKVFEDTMKDREFLAEAQKARLPIGPKGGEEMARVIADLAKLPPDLLARMKKLLVPAK